MPFVIETGGNATLISGGAITFLPGSVIANGAGLQARITNSGQYCNAMKTAGVLAQQERPTPNEPGKPGKATPGFRIGPNPTSGPVRVEVNPGNIGGISRVAVYSLVGKQLIYQDVPESQLIDFSIASLPRGVYILQVTIGQTTGNVKLIKH
jgi:hypothetical protein